MMAPSRSLRPAENRPHRHNLPPRDYEDESALCQPRPSDSPQLRELRSRVKLMVGKLSAARKEKEASAKEVARLEGEVASLQESLRHTVGGFSNTSSSFPMPAELAARLADFYKCDCLDLFFDLLGPEELTLKGVIYFFLRSFKFAAALVEGHFEPALSALATANCLPSLEGPLMNVLRKSFQSRHAQIAEAIAQEQPISIEAGKLVQELGVACMPRGEAEAMVGRFMVRLVGLVLECRISDPPLQLCVEEVGARVEFNGLLHDPFDGFIRAREECFVILPGARRQEGETVAKSLVLHRDYDLSL